jgi:hypothetical protein
MVAPIFAETIKQPSKANRNPMSFKKLWPTTKKHGLFFIKHGLEPMPPDVQDMYRFDLCTKQPGWPGGGRGSGSSPHRLAIRGMIPLW